MTPCQRRVWRAAFAWAAKIRAHRAGSSQIIDLQHALLELPRGHVLVYAAAVTTLQAILAEWRGLDDELTRVRTSRALVRMRSTP